MVDAGYEEARGAFIYVDGRYVTPHRYKKDSITEDQTFSISAEDAAIQSVTNLALKKLVETGAYQYVDAHFVLNHPKYLVNEPNGMPYLTDYARNHMDECCIPFDMSVRSSDKKDYYSVCYLNKDEDSTVSFDIKYGKGFAYSTPDKQAKLGYNIGVWYSKEKIKKSKENINKLYQPRKIVTGRTLTIK